MSGSRVLLIGYGNPARGDDGLGPALAAAVQKMGLDHVSVDSDYQLSVEDAATAAEHDVVIFADAAVTGPEPFAFTRIEPRPSVSFSTHSVLPEAVVGLTEALFGAKTTGYLLAIRGHDFNAFSESLSPQAQANLERATAFLSSLLPEGDFERAVTDRDESTTENNQADRNRNPSMAGNCK